MVTSDGEPPGAATFPSTGWGGGTPHNILDRPVMLDEVKIRGGDGVEGHSEITNDGNRLQENFRQEHGGTPIEKHTASVHLLHQGAKQAEIGEGRGAERGSFSRGMHVRNVRADGQMNGDGNSAPIGLDQHAGLRMLRSRGCRWSDIVRQPRRSQCEYGRPAWRFR